MSKVVIRPAKFGDINQIMAVNARNLPENYSEGFWRATFAEGGGKSRSFVATYASDIVGYIFCDSESIVSFAIDEAFRRLGVGRQLMHHCLNAQTGPIHLHVRVDNESAIALYTSVGFTATNVIEGYYSYGNALEMRWERTKMRHYKETKKIAKK